MTEEQREYLRWYYRTEDCEYASAILSFLKILPVTYIHMYIKVGKLERLDSSSELQQCTVLLI